MYDVDPMRWQGHTDEDTEIRSRSPANSVSRRRERRTKTEFVVSRLGSTARKIQKKETKRRKTSPKDYVESSQDGSDTTATAMEHLCTEAKGPDPRNETAASIATRVVDIGVVAVRWIHSPVIQTMLAAVIMSFTFSWISSQVTSIIRPVCSAPIISPMIPFCHLSAFKHQVTSESGQPVLRADYPRLVALQTKTFDQLLDKDVENKGLALEVKKAEMASHDLITLVRVSDLRSRDRIAERLGQFAEDAKRAGESLHSLGAKVQGAVDS